MTDALAPVVSTPPPEERHFVALTPADVPGQQAEIAQWCAQKIQALRTQRSDFLDNARFAKDHSWQHESLEGHARRVQREIEYYEKLGAAVSAGYLIIPNLDIDLIAIRVKSGSKPPSNTNPTQIRPNLLAAGDGEYVDNVAFGKTVRTQMPPRIQGGEPWIETTRVATRYDHELDFPVALVKPIVMSATQRALSMRIFDQVGVAQGNTQRVRRTGTYPDPIVVGQVIDPRVPRQWRPKVVSFFIAWWLDTRSL